MKTCPIHETPLNGAGDCFLCQHPEKAPKPELVEKPEKPWVIVGHGGSHFSCLRCGATLKIQLPCRVEDWCDAGKAFDDRHKQCLPEEVSHDR